MLIGGCLVLGNRCCDHFRADYDWSNMKAVWVNAKPMDCEKLLVTQAELNRRINPKSRAFVSVMGVHRTRRDDTVHRALGACFGGCFVPAPLYYRGTPTFPALSHPPPPRRAAGIGTW